MGGGRGQGCDIGAQQPDFAIPKDRVSFFQVAARGAQAFDFPTRQYDPGFDLVFDEIVEARLAIFDDKAGSGAFGRFAGFG